MSSALRTVIERLRRDALAAPRRAFDESRARHAALAGHADVASALAALADDREHTYPERDALRISHTNAFPLPAGRAQPSPEST
jgi:hypothetical protein